MKSMISVDAVLVLVKDMIDKYEMKYNKRPTVVYLGNAQQDAIIHEGLRFSAIGEEANVYGLKIIRALAADFVGVGSEENEMSAISAELVKARAEMMLGEHFRKFNFPNFIVLGKEQFREAVMILELSTHTDKTYFCGVEVMQVPISNYIGVI